jgi:hypothetical protein
MAEQSFPFENIDTTEAQFSEWATNFQETGVQGSPTGTELGITVTGSDLNLTVAAGQAFIRGHYYINTSDLVLAVTSAGVNTRIDIVVVELDPTANTIVTKIVSGTAASADPVAPTLTQSATGIYQLPIATLTIPTSTVAITAGMLVDTRTFMGQRVGIWTTATRPTNPVDNQTFGYNSTEGEHEYWNGSAWVSFAAPSTGLFFPATGLLRQAPSTLTAGLLYAIEVYSVSGTPTLDLRGFDSSSNQVFQLSVSDIQRQITWPENVAKLYWTASGTATFSISEIVNSDTASTVSVVTVSASGSVTLANEALVVAFGGGGSGAGTNVNQPAGGGGGSGYLAMGTLAAGTYTAVIGAGAGVGATNTAGQAGGETSIGGIVAAGGLGGFGNTVEENAGGDGGSGGGGGRRNAYGGGAGGAPGFNGGEGGSGYQIGAGGTGSGTTFAGVFALVQTPGTTTNYAGGRGGDLYGFNYGTNGTDGVAYANGGGGGSTRDGNGLAPQQQTGGVGFRGQIFIIGG